MCKESQVSKETSGGLKWIIYLLSQHTQETLLENIRYNMNRPGYSGGSILILIVSVSSGGLV